MTPFMTINDDVAKVIRHSQNIKADLNVELLMDKWYEAKKKIISAWGGNLIMEVPDPMSFHLSTAEKRCRVDEFSGVVATNYNNEALADFIDWASAAEIFNNKIERDYLDWDGEVIVTAGTKFVKAFKHFEKDERILRELQDRCSAIIQEDKITGVLTFSVHPLDFLSASENTHHWRSCHALDGEYRAGNLSYMMDSSTIICYLRTKDELVKLPHFPEDVLWNSKKWRMWLFLDDNWNAMFAGRQYPFFSPFALDLVQNHFLASIGSSSSGWTAWYNDYLHSFTRSNGRTEDLNDSYVAIRHELYKMKDLVTDCPRPLHFNDLLHSSCYTPYYSSRYTSSKKYHFSIGGEVPCPCCDGRNNIRRSCALLCDPCELEFGEGENDDIRYCAHCDTRAFYSTMTYVEGLDDWVCEECENKYVRECERCGSTWFATDLTYNREKEKWECPWCARAVGAPQRIIFDDSDWDLPF